MKGTLGTWDVLRGLDALGGGRLVSFVQVLATESSLGVSFSRSDEQNSTSFWIVTMCHWDRCCDSHTACGHDRHCPW